jgi:hypothetical protein
MPDDAALAEDYWNAIPAAETAVITQFEEAK